MKLHFLGAATTVTGSQFLLETDQARVLIDCGMFQGSPSEVLRNHDGFAYEPASLDAVLLTHAHLDHCGLLPLLGKQGYRGPIHATRATAELARLVLLDSGKLQVEHAQAYRERLDRLARRAAHEAPAASAAGESAPPSEPRSALPPSLIQTAGGQRSAGPGAPFPRGGSDPERPDPETVLRMQPPAIETALSQPLYDADDAERSLAQFRGLDYGELLQVAPGISAVFHDAGHILGSAIIVVEASDRTGPPQRIVFSGDLGRPATPILRDPTAIIDGADYVLCESTYGGREHEPEAEAVRLLAEAIGATAQHTGVLLIPSFAIGRTQEIIWQLDRLLEAGRIPHLPLYVDSPMASAATDIYRGFPGYYDEETARLLHDGASPLDYPGAEFTTTAEQSKAIRTAPRPYMIMSASGMLTGGRIVHHLHNLIDDPKAMILFVGYQGEGTLGAHLQAGAAQVRIDGEWRDVRCEIRSISGFSAHADESELVDWLRHFAGAARRPREVFIVHGDPDAELAMEGRIRELGLAPHRPTWREAVDLG
ncbi:MAG: MBL fold metallo-hydrolase RNA specificity domain-containing protein [Candidatus Limnocylindrales bacterium]